MYMFVSPVYTLSPRPLACRISNGCSEKSLNYLQLTSNWVSELSLNHTTCYTRKMSLSAIIIKFTIIIVYSRLLLLAFRGTAATPGVRNKPAGYRSCNLEATWKLEHSSLDLMHESCLIAEFNNYIQCL